MRSLVGKLSGRVGRPARELAEKAAMVFRARRKAALLGLGGLAAALVAGLVLAAVGQSRVRSAEARSGETAGSFQPLPIAPEDFFFPEEPDAFPEFILARPRRKGWTAEDAAEYWTDPRAGKEALWRSRLGAAVEDLLEAVP
jgi:hypothetical protein